MKTYRIHEGEFSLPDVVQDNTINAFELPQPPGRHKANIVITRDASTKAENVERYADLQLVESAKKLKGYELIDRRSVIVGHLQAIEAEHKWQTPEKVRIHQRQLYLRPAKHFLIFTLSAAADDFALYEGVWRTMRDSLSFRAE